MSTKEFQLCAQAMLDEHCIAATFANVRAVGYGAVCDHHVGELTLMTLSVSSNHMLSSCEKLSMQ